MKKRAREPDALTELDQLAQGRHASQEDIVAMYRRCTDWKKATSILRRAVKADNRYSKGTPLTPPAGWLPPMV